MRKIRAWSLLFLLLFPAFLFAGIQSSLAEFEARIPKISSQIPQIIKSAEFAAGCVLKKPDTLINVPYNEQKSFSEEMINRAGGLSNIYPSESPDRVRFVTDHDIVLYSVRSWETDAETAIKRLNEYKGKNWKVILIASKKGMPSKLKYDFFIDNGAPSGKAIYGRINILANITIGWMWCCEYVSAMTRKGKIPGILISISLEESTEHNKKIQTPEGRLWIGDCPEKIPAGKLANIYLERVKKLVFDLKSEKIQKQIDYASDIIASRMAEGKRVGISGVGHVIIDEVKRDLKAPWIGFQAVGQVGRRRNAFSKYLQPGDLLVWIAYIGLNSKYVDFGRYIKEANLELITCFAPDLDDPSVNETGIAHIDQCWAKGDAEVPLPCHPWKMAPVSGINSGLVLRMLDDSVSKKLENIKNQVKRDTQVSVTQ
ncbi:MAG: hypothetical protein BWX89_00200 [candidate division TA06 bacterium ADurb.Bin131]|jgi:uncharacterized phosphosugar-binding protein|uniref:Uncharacterized protein n=1 Tax=candidate division TA06 bacterium ADurb.Bin131 TaxID=1852827 RepID=A0A1V6CDW1_UNCT6|nr:MAG: hypothetical protein BWX89_00200 [candidate division TA06 bacterium ADurb.Bin131]